MVLFMKRDMQVNHLRNHYSKYLFMFIKRYVDELNVNMKIVDIGAGHFRNMKLFEELGFRNLYALDKENTDNPLKVNLIDFKLQDIEQGISYKNQEFDIVLCNYVLMFINVSKINQVVDNLLRITKGFLIIETYKQKSKVSKNTHYKDYSFMQIVRQIEGDENFELLQVRKYHEKLIARRVING